MASLSILEMHRLIEQDVQKMGYFAYSNLETEEIDLQINTQIDKYIEDVLDKKANKIRKPGVLEGFQENQVVLDKLRTLHVKDREVAISDFDDSVPTDSGKKFTFAEDHLHFIKAKAIVEYDCYENKKKVTKTLLSPVRVLKSTDIDSYRILPFYKTSKNSVLAEIADNSLYLYINDDFKINKVLYDYIKKPAVVKYAKNPDGSYNSGNSVNCDLPLTEHRKIVANTVIKIAMILESNPQKIVNIQQEVN